MTRTSSSDFTGAYQLADYLQAISDTFKQGIEAGWPEGTPSHILERVNYMEYNPTDRGEPWGVMQKATIKLFQTLTPEIERAINAGLRGAAFWEDISWHVEETIRDTIMGLETPRLLEKTIEIKERDADMGLAPAAKIMGADKIFFKTGESFSAITHRIKHRSAVTHSIYIGV